MLVFPLLQPKLENWMLFYEKLILQKGPMAEISVLNLKREFYLPIAELKLYHGRFQTYIYRSPLGKFALFSQMPVPPM